MAERTPRRKADPSPAAVPPSSFTGALLDRLTHHVHVLTCNGDSYRLADAKRRHTKPKSAPEKDA